MIKLTTFATLIFCFSTYSFGLSNTPLSESKSRDLLKEKALEDLKKIEWYTVSRYDHDDIMLNANNIVVNHQLSRVTAHVRHAPLADVEKGIFNNFEEYVEIHDCLNSTVKASRRYVYKDGELLETQEWQIPWEMINKNSVGEQIHKDACEYLELID